jgi:hypothetical protein
VKDCAASQLTTREYAALKKIGYSTLTKWATQQRVSLAKDKEKISPSFQAKVNFLNKASELDSSLKPDNNGNFSFISLTASQNKTADPVFSPFLLGQASQETSCPKDLPVSCDMEIRMPNGVTLKIGRIPFQALWPQVVEFIQTLGNADVVKN